MVVGLSEERIDKERVRRFLARLYGFYRTWEPWIQSSPIEEDFFQPRRKLPLVRSDLLALGVRDVDGLPCLSPQIGPATLERAMGSLYVVEGSTLGGRLIGRWLQNAPWLPPGGLAYFNSYGSDVGLMWRAFQEKLVETAVSASQDEIIQAAKHTFDCLNAWLCEKKEIG